MIRLLPALLLVAPLLAAAQSRDDSRIDGHAANGVQGATAINVAAGTGNAQANLQAIATADRGAGAVLAVQHVDAGGADLTREAHAVISGDALGGANGLVGLNQVAGSANAQANLLAIGPDALAGFVQQVDNLALAATAAPADPSVSPTTPSPVREARIDAGAIAAPTGVVQINQTAGVGNASANAIVLQLPGGTP